jgi:hypothetical protein
MLWSQPTKYVRELPILILDSSSLPFAPFFSRCGQGIGGFGPPPPLSRGAMPGDCHCRGTTAATGLLLLLSPSRRGVPSRRHALAGQTAALGCGAALPILGHDAALHRSPRPLRGGRGPRRRPLAWLSFGAPFSLSSVCSVFAHMLQ